MFSSCQSFAEAAFFIAFAFTNIKVKFKLLVFLSDTEYILLLGLVLLLTVDV